jgi:hypothetical protein
MKVFESREAGRDRGSRSLWRACVSSLATVALGAAAFGAAASTTTATPTKAGHVNHPFLAKSARKPMFVLRPHADISEATLDAQAAVHRTIPFWRAHITSPLRAQDFSYDMVGNTPYAAPSRAVIPYVPIVARVHFQDGTVLDPTQPGNCDPVSPAVRFMNSPLFQPAVFTSNGVNVSAGVRGGTQLTSAFQRANFWSNVQRTQFGVALTPAHSPIVVDVLAPARASQVFSFPITCPNGTMPTINLGTIDINTYDGIVQNLIAKYARSDQFPIVLTYNIVQTIGGGCCVIGYHNAVAVATGTQTYAVGAYTDAVFSAPQIHDIYAWSHEMSEWLDDPFVQALVNGGNLNNTTPPWGHTGQVSGCQTNLETGDPLTGVGSFEIQGAGGFLYSFQDEAFHDWFYRTPSTGTGGMFSFEGTFTTDAGPRCH